MRKHQGEGSSGNGGKEEGEMLKKERWRKNTKQGRRER